MNLIAMIGTIDKISKINRSSTNLYLRVEKPFKKFVENYDNYQLIPIELNNRLFKTELGIMNIGLLIGFKGRLLVEDNGIKVIAERIQMF